jgi:hypothetical protein
LTAADDDLDCRAASRLLSVAWERALDEGERIALGRHLDACLMCTNFAAQLKFLRAAAQRYREGG